MAKRSDAARLQGLPDLEPERRRTNGGWLPQHLLLPAVQHEQAPEEGEIGA